MRSSNSSTDLLHSSTCWVRPMPRVSVVPWLSCWLMVSDVPCDIPSEVLCEVPVCSVAEWLVPHEVFTPMEPPMFRAMLLKAVLDGAMPPMALPAVPSSGPITAPATGIATEATAPPRPRMPAMPPATGETFVTEVPELLPTPPLMPPLTPFVFWVPSVTEEDWLVPSVVVVLTVSLMVWEVPLHRLSITAVL